jgi:hypothetical protein
MSVQKLSLTGTLQEQVVIGGEGTGLAITGLGFEADLSRVPAADRRCDRVVTLPGVLRKRAWPMRGELVTFDVAPESCGAGEVIVRLTGLLRGGVMAVGQETTGYAIEDVSIEVAPPAGLDVTAWIGDRVTAHGAFEVRSGVERGDYAVFAAASMAPAHENPEVYTNSIALGTSGGFVPTTTQTVVTRSGRAYVKTTSFTTPERNALRRLPDVPAPVAAGLFALVEAIRFREIPSGAPSSFSVFVHVAAPTWQHTVYLRHGAARGDRLLELVTALQRVVAGAEVGDEPAAPRKKPGRFIVTERIDGGSCQVIGEDELYTMDRRRAFGPDSREACERWKTEHCGRDGG